MTNLLYYKLPKSQPDRMTAIAQARKLCRCYRSSFVGVQWRDSSGIVHTATWDEVDRGDG